jgi:hypothetical protein
MLATTREHLGKNKRIYFEVITLCPFIVVVNIDNSEENI